MVGVDTHIVILQVKGVLAELDMLEFIFVEVRPAPQPCINHMRKTFPPCHLRREHNIITTQNNTILVKVHALYMDDNKHFKKSEMGSFVPRTGSELQLTRGDWCLLPSMCNQLCYLGVT